MIRFQKRADDFLTSSATGGVSFTLKQEFVMQAIVMRSFILKGPTNDEVYYSLRTFLKRCTMVYLSIIYALNSTIAHNLGNLPNLKRV
jgi:hypothetical protein